MEFSQSFIAFWAIFAVFGMPLLFIVIIVWIISRNKRKSEQAIAELYIKALERGEKLPENFPAMPHGAEKKSNPLKTAIILISAGVGFSLFMYLSAPEEVKIQSIAIGIIPFVIGLGYLVIHLVEGKRTSSANEE